VAQDDRLVERDRQAGSTPFPRAQGLVMELLLNLKIWLLVLIISVLGTIVTLAYYYLGKQGVRAVLARFPQLKHAQWDRVQHLYEEHGSGLLFFSSLPVVGVLFTAVAGAVDIGLATYFLWVLLGRMFRNWIILLLFDQTLVLFFGR
jgi:membrane protein YqaA with SNARE-associated domain